MPYSLSGRSKRRIQSVCDGDFRVDLVGFLDDAVDGRTGHAIGFIVYSDSHLVWSSGLAFGVVPQWTEHDAARFVDLTWTTANDCNRQSA